jgi:hypothetical protein
MGWEDKVMGKAEEIWLGRDLITEAEESGLK